MIKKKILIGIAAYNEEKNIGHLLRSILSQKGDNFKIENIIVACDGCTDRTSIVAGKFQKNYPLIKVINDNRRKGKTSRLNEFYRMLKSDIFITLDADIILAHKYVVSE